MPTVPTTSFADPRQALFFEQSGSVFYCPAGYTAHCASEKKVGINTPEPQAMLDVAGDMRVDGSPSQILSFSKGQAASGITVNGKAVQRNVGVSIPLRPPFRRHGACSMRVAQLRSLIFHLPSRKFLMSISPRRTAITPCLWSEAVQVAGLQQSTPERYLP